MGGKARTAGDENLAGARSLIVTLAGLNNARKRRPPHVHADRTLETGANPRFTPISLHGRLKRSIVVNSQVAGDSFDG